jgi:protein-tyrosine phosphatase
MADARPAPDLAALIRRISGDGRRHLRIEGTLNFRDIGGYPVQGGGTTGWRTLFRSDALHRVDAEGTSAIIGLGLRTVLDLRVLEELLIAQSPMSAFADRGIRTIHLSLVGDDFSELPPELEGVYTYLVDQRGPAIGAAIKRLAAPGTLPALVHCTAGKDRTGLVIAFTLAALGVPDEVIAADYALSSMYLVSDQVAVIGQLGADTGLGEQLTEALMASPPELIVRSLDRARQQAGGIAGYLASNGVTEAELAALRAALVTSEPDEPRGEADDSGIRH